MQTPALRTFLNQVGKVVHHLNTIAVGLSAVESGAATKPIGLDISWHPSDIVASGRQARAFALRATVVMVAEELGAYVSDVASSPACENLTLQDKPDRSAKLEALRAYFSLNEDHLFLGPLLLIHWRNRIVHRASRACLTKAQREVLIGESAILKDGYKNLDPILLLHHFDQNTPSLKDVSSLIAMTINFVKSVEQAVPEPASMADVMKWIKHLKLEVELDRVVRTASAKGKLNQGISNLLSTNCPTIEAAYFQHCHDDA